jgi:hypothetical protein
VRRLTGPPAYRTTGLPASRFDSHYPDPLPSTEVFLTLRHHRFISHWLAVTLLVTGWLVPMTVPHSALDDELCSPIFAASRGDQPTLVAGSGVKHPGHCVICHAVRSFRSTLTDSGPVSISLALGASIAAPADSPHRAVTEARLPARAPPQA